MDGSLLAVTDADIYMRLQPSKGTAPTLVPFKSALRFTKVQVDEVKDVIEGEAGLGQGLYSGEALGTSFVLNWNTEARCTTKTQPSMIWDWIAERTTTAEGPGSTAPFRHRWSPILRNYQLPWIMLAVLYGVTNVPGAALTKKFLRDCRLAGLQFSVSSKDVIRFQINGTAFNQGPGLGSETFEIDETEVQPSPVNPAVNVLSWPSTWNSVLGINLTKLCITEITAKWVPQQAIGDPCINDAEKSGVVINRAHWELTFMLPINGTDVIKLHNYLQTGQTTPSAGYGAMNPAIRKGTFRGVFKSVDLMGPSSPLNVPYEFSFEFPLQFKGSIMRSNQGPQMIELTAVSYNDAWWVEVLNDVPGDDMTLAAA